MHVPLFPNLVLASVLALAKDFGCSVGYAGCRGLILPLRTRDGPRHVFPSGSGASTDMGSQCANRSGFNNDSHDISYCLSSVISARNTKTSSVISTSSPTSGSLSSTLSQAGARGGAVAVHYPRDLPFGGGRESLWPACYVGQFLSSPSLLPNRGSDVSMWRRKNRLLQTGDSVAELGIRQKLQRKESGYNSGI